VRYSAALYEKPLISRFEFLELRLTTMSTLNVIDDCIDALQVSSMTPNTRNTFQSDSLVALTAELLTCQKKCKVQAEEIRRLEEALRPLNKFPLLKPTPEQRAIEAAFNVLEREIKHNQEASLNRNGKAVVDVSRIQELVAAVHSQRTQIAHFKVSLSTASEKNSQLVDTLKEQQVKHERIVNDLQEEFYIYQEQQQPVESPSNASRRIVTLEEELKKSEVRNEALQQQYKKLYEYLNIEDA